METLINIILGVVAAMAFVRLCVLLASDETTDLVERYKKVK
jgi:hypothetical protein